MFVYKRDRRLLHPPWPTTDLCESWSGKTAKAASTQLMSVPADLREASRSPGGPLLFQVRCSMVVSISDCHAEDPGSIPGSGDFVCMASGHHQRTTLELARDFKQKYADLGAGRRLWLQCRALT